VFEPTQSKLIEEGILVSGGYGDAITSVEVFSPLTGESCSLPSLPDHRYRHTMDGLLICGGDLTTVSCLTFSSGEWTRSNTLVEPRTDHTSWQTEEGVVLIGGDYGYYTTELVHEAGVEGELSFDMQNATYYACSMPDLTSNSVIVTGGVETLQSVFSYDPLGFIEELPLLLHGRYRHGCGSYLRESDGTQVLLVAGGVNYDYHFLTSTEILTDDSDIWSLSNPLPRRLGMVKGVTSGGKLYFTGGYDRDDYDIPHRDEIYTWLDEDQEWMEVGKLKIGRSDHAVTTIKMDDQFMKFCH